MKYTVISSEEAKAITGWKEGMDEVDHGSVSGLYRGYNFEVTTRDGKVDFMSCTFIPDEIEEYVAEDGFYSWYMKDMGLTPTGRVIFRGYYEEAYCPEERDYGYVLVQGLFD